MSQHKILARTFFILSIINFALAAPVAVRERPEVHLDANLIRNMTAASQKRWDPWELWDEGSTYGPGQDHTPPTGQDSTAWLDSNFPELYWATSAMPEGPLYTYSLRPLLSSLPEDNTGSLMGPNYVLPGQESPIESQLPVGSEPVAGHLSPPPPLPHPSQPGPSEDYFMSPPYVSESSDPLSGTGNHPTPPHSPGMGPEIHALLHPEPFPTEFWDKLLKVKLKRRISGSDAVNLAQRDPRSRVFQP
jgi:hypothetical protein